MVFLTETDAIWEGMLADILEQHNIPFVKKSSMGAGMAIRAGNLNEKIGFYVPEEHLSAAQDLVKELFGKAE